MNTWWEEKSALARGLEKAAIATPSVTIPAYDETNTYLLLSRIAQQMKDGSLTYKQYDQLKRLTIQERMLKNAAALYVSTAQSPAESLLRLTGLYMKMAYLTDGYLSLCGESQPALKPTCIQVKKQANRSLFRQLDLLARLLTPNHTPPGGIEWQIDALDRALYSQKQRFELGANLLDGSLDPAIYKVLPDLFIRPYLARTQFLVEKGVASADSANRSYNVWELTGDAAAAQKASDASESRMKIQADAQAAAALTVRKEVDWASLTKEIAALQGGSEKPYAILMQIAGASGDPAARTLNYAAGAASRLKCIEALAKQASEAAFDPSVALEGCPWLNTQSSRQPAVNYLTALRLPSVFERASRKAVLATPLPANTILSERITAYRRQADTLVKAQEKGDRTVFQNALQSFITAQENLSVETGLVQKAILQDGNLNPARIQVLENITRYELDNIALYAAALEVLESLPQGAGSVNALRQSAAQASAHLALVEQAALEQKVNPHAEPLLAVVQGVQVRRWDAEKIYLAVQVQNVGVVELRESRITVQWENRSTSVPVNIPARGSISAEVSLPLPAPALIIVQVWSKADLMDARVLDVTTLDIASVVTATVTPASTPAPSVFKSNPSLVLYIGGGVVGLFLLWVILSIVALTRRKKT